MIPIALSGDTAIAYEKGWGTPINSTEMMKYLQKSADKGDPMAITKLKEIKAMATGIER